MHLEFGNLGVVFGRNKKSTTLHFRALPKQRSHLSVAALMVKGL
jgi:hypothetical protein